MQEHTPRAIAYFQKLEETLHATSLLIFEFKQSLRLQTFLHRQHRKKGLPANITKATLSDLQEDIGNGALKIVTGDFAEILSIADRLSHQHIPQQGHRTMDILHVATALYFGAQDFLSFDKNQVKLAKAGGLGGL